MFDFKVTEEEARLFQQWFDCLQDSNPRYLEPSDYVLAERIYRALGMRVPNSITDHLPR